MNTLVHHRFWPVRSQTRDISKSARAVALLASLSLVAIAVNSAIIVAASY